MNSIYERYLLKLSHDAIVKEKGTYQLLVDSEAFP